MAKSAPGKSSKSYSLQVRLNPHELAALNRAAATSALPMSAWVRWVALKAASEALGQPIDRLVPRELPKGVRAKSKRARSTDSGGA